MKNRKKLSAVTAFAVVAALVVPTIASADTVSFTDISGSYAAAAIQDLASQGILNGTGNGMFSPKANVTRQDFAIILAKALKLDVSNPPSTATFSDVPTTNYAFKYVEAVAKAGYIHGTGNGMFGYGANLTRQDMAIMLVNALGVNYSGAASNLNFNDNSAITYGQDQVGYAVKAGLVHGMGDGSFGPRGLATREMVAAISENFLKVVATQNETLSLSATSTNVAIGQKVQLTLTGSSNAVTWSVDKNGVVDASGNFVGTAAGTATVTATVDGKSVTKTITVYGAASNVSIGAVKDLIANGTSTQTVTISAVDANGNVASNFNGTATATTTGTINFVDPTNNNAVLTGAQTLDFVNGQATVTIQAGALAVVGTPAAVNVYGLTDANGVNLNTNLTSANPVTTDVNLVAQVATKVTVTAGSNYINANNNSGTDKFTAYVVDQDGQPMKSGAYAITFTANGPVTLDVANPADANTTNQYTTTYTSANATNGVSFTVDSVQGSTGAITVNAASTGLTAGSATATAAIAGNAKNLTVALDSSETAASFVEGTAAANSVVYDVSATDGNNVPVSYTVPATGSTIYAYVTDANGNAPANIQINGSANSTNGVLLNSNKITITDTAGGADAGTYKLVVKDTAATPLTASASQTFTETAGAAADLALSAANDYVLASSPKTTVTAQVTDAFGNNVAKSGESVTISAANATNGSLSEASFNGAAVSATPTVTVTTDANGQAQVSFAAQSYNAQWNFTAKTADSYTQTGTPSITVLSQATSALKATLVNDNGSTTLATAGQSLNLSIAENDQYGNAIATSSENDTVKLTVSPGITFKNTGVTSSVPAGTVPGVTFGTDANGNTTLTGTVTAINTFLGANVSGVHSNVFAAKAGTATVAVADQSVSATSGSAAIGVQADKQVGYDVFDANGNDLTASGTQVTVAANTPVALTIKAVDAEGNVVLNVPTSGNASTVNLSDASAGGQFRTSASGLSSTTVSLPAGSTGVTVYYINATAGTYTISAN